jgi:hypothetical protein
MNSATSFELSGRFLNESFYTAGTLPNSATETFGSMLTKQTIIQNPLPASPLIWVLTRLVRSKQERERGF